MWMPTLREQPAESKRTAAKNKLVLKNKGPHLQARCGPFYWVCEDHVSQAVINKDNQNKESLMGRYSRSSLLVLVAVLTVPLAFTQTDADGSKDYPGITRMPNTWLQTYNHLKFDAFNFPIATVHNQYKYQSVEGERYFIRYKVKEGAETTSPLQEIRNYENAAKAAGGQVVWDLMNGANGGEATLRLHKGASEVWIYVNAYTNQYELNIVEKQAMAQEVTVDAAAMAGSIADTGSVAIYGIYFDTAKSDLKPESDPAIDEIAKLLTGNPALKVYIVGHTDMVGEAAGNLKLSQARAQSVINALVSKHGIGAARLIAFGNGPYAPVASNKSDEGRAKNRRVDLVEIATK
jgi:outer membrane protein OmpA-like peptidoglycan-associated protein